MDIEGAKELLKRLREDPERDARSEADEEFEEIAPATLAALILAVEALEAAGKVIHERLGHLSVGHIPKASQDIKKALAAWRAL